MKIDFTSIYFYQTDIQTSKQMFSQLAGPQNVILISRTAEVANGFLIIDPDLFIIVIAF